ncbi:hypothetical protein [Streptomyces sp. FBKL.4005]|uniref:hypothetical protein n=1 Tax=Streptomyces sp. FBKL.4005 TaxID=2015515 RepID=UPI00117EAA59|nr:hypothetical protein [Streptomyces sp. FBKL.4005]
MPRPGVSPAGWPPNSGWSGCGARPAPAGRSVRPEPTTTGLETWFDGPGTPAEPPARGKTSRATMLAVYPFALVYDGLVAEYGHGWPPPLRTLVFPIVLALLLTYAVMPGPSRAPRRRLHPGA